MRVGDLARLDCRPGRIADIGDHLVAMARGRAVLNVGCAGGASYYLPDRTEAWLHARFANAAADLTGVDIDTEEIAHATKHGWTIVEANCEDMQLDRRFDAIMLVDVIEHVANPGRALDNLVAHLKPGGAVYITTPNPTFVADMARAMLGWGPSTYWDHVACFAPEHLQALCDRHKHALSNVLFFSHRDSRSSLHRLKSGAIAAAGRFNLRLNNAWLGVVQARA